MSSIDLWFTRAVRLENSMTVVMTWRFRNHVATLWVSAVIVAIEIPVVDASDGDCGVAYGQSMNNSANGIGPVERIIVVEIFIVDAGDQQHEDERCEG